MTPSLLAHAGPFVSVSAAAAVGLAGGLVVVGRRRGAGRRRGPVVAGALAAAAVLVAVVGPVVGRAEAAFSWHMAQHLLLAGLVPALLALAHLGPDLRRGLGAVAPALARRRRAVAHHGVVRWAAGRPVLAAVVASAVLWAWHHPALFQAALGSGAIHGLEHVSMSATAAVAWLLAVRGRAGHGAGLAALLVLALAGATLGALLTFAPRPLYPTQTAVGDALADQQAAGLLMWVPGGLVPLVGAALLAADWVRVAGRRVEGRERLRVAARRAAVRASTPSAGVLLAVLVLLAGCGGGGGDADRARDAIDAHGCAACHVVPGVAGGGRVGPSLVDYGEQRYVAGSLVNTEDNLVRWIRDPQGVEPGTAMPDLGVSEEDARAIAAYLLGGGG